MRKYIYLIRHGECLSNLDPHFNGPEDTLSAKGEIDARSVAKRFAHIYVSALYHSGILRAQKTAEEIEKVCHIAPEVKEFLKERRGAFSADGTYGYVEDIDQLKIRLADTQLFLESLSSKHTIIVSHSIFLKAFIGYLIHGNALTEEIATRVDDMFIMDNTGVSTLMFNEEKRKWRILSWNDLTHLAE
jgi:broad specificity phosphatase PhoE